MVQLALSRSDAGCTGACCRWRIRRPRMDRQTRRRVCPLLSLCHPILPLRPTDSRLLAGTLRSAQSAATARIQFAMSGINAHINHDLPQAIVATSQAAGPAPQHGTAHYNDYTALNSTLDDMIERPNRPSTCACSAMRCLRSRQLEDTLAAWSVSAARESAWNNAELLWHLAEAPILSRPVSTRPRRDHALASKTLLVPVPFAACRSMP